LLFFLWWIMKETCQADDAKKTYEVTALFIWFFLFFLQHQLDPAVHIHSLCNSKVCWWQWMDVHNRSSGFASYWCFTSFCSGLFGWQPPMIYTNETPLNC
jgi:hypothetical protein